MSADGLAGRGTTGGNAEAARGRRGQRTGTERGSAAGAGAGEAAAPDTAARETTGQGVPADGRAREMLAVPGPNVTLVGSETDHQRANAAPAQAAAAPEPQRQAPAPATTTSAATAPVADGPSARDPFDSDLFARYTRDYVSAREGQQITILQAGCTTADGDLGIGMLQAAGADVTVSLIDDDQPATRVVLSTDESMAGCIHGDLRTLPLPPRSHDIVLCTLLLQRIRNAELVLDRLVATIRPGGLLLLRFGDRDSAAGFLDRILPTVARRAVWRQRRPGQPGPYEAVYERVSSARGIQAYALMRELVIAERRALGGLAGGMSEPYGFLTGQKLIAWLSRGRLTAAHEELLYVLRKPEDRFARVL